MDDHEKAISIIREAIPYVRQVHDDTACSYYGQGEDFMNGYLFSVMQDTGSLLAEMVTAIDRFDKVQ